MTQVFQRYKGGPGETLLALALADCASDDGSRIYPSVSEMSRKTRQSERTVQTQLKRMIATTWLIKRTAGDGGRSRKTSYCINPMWVKGAEIAPIEDDSGAAPAIEDADTDLEDAAQSGPECPPGGDADVQGDGGGVVACAGLAGTIENRLNGANSAGFKGCKPGAETPQIMSLNPANSAGAIEPYEPLVNTPLPPCQGADPLACADAEPSGQIRVQATAPKTAVKVSKGKGRKGKAAAVGLEAYLAACREQGVKPVPAGGMVFAYVDRVGIGHDVLALHWAEFKRRHIASGKRQSDWSRTLLNSVSGNWYGLWYLSADGGCVLTTKGIQAQRYHAAGEPGQ